VNLLALLGLLRDGEPHCTPELAGPLQLDPSTVTRLLSDLCSRGLVGQVGVAASGTVGRPPKVWQLEARAGCVLGLTVGLGSVRGVLAGIDGGILAEYAVMHEDSDPPPSLESAVRDVRGALLAMAKSGPLLGAGVSLAGAVDAEHGVVRAAGPPVWEPGAVRDWPVGGILETELGCPVITGNDANVAAAAVFAEAVRQGELEPGDSLAYCLGLRRSPLWWGGIGFVMGGRVHAGSHCAAGELFYGRPPELPGHPSFAAHARDMEAALRGDRHAAERLRPVLRPNVQYLVSLTVALDPRRVVFGGTYSTLAGTLSGLLDEASDDLARLHPWLGRGSLPTLTLDPLWPRTLELGAVGMALDRLYAPAADSRWDLLARVASANCASA
jgi:predicted NBD/HSP70 family sugar kinase